MNPISNLPLAGQVPPTPARLDPASNSTGSFKNLLVEGLNQMNAMQQDADAAVQQLATGGDVNPAEVLTAVQKADMAFRMTLQIRNKLVQAYQEIKEIRI